MSKDTKKVLIKLANSSWPRRQDIEKDDFSDASYATGSADIERSQAYMSKSHDSLKLTPGLNLIIGKSATGKSLLISSLAKELDSTVQEFFEPVPFSRTSMDELCKLIYDACMQSVLAEGKSNYLFIDSLKGLVYAGGSNLGKGGVSMSMLQQLSDLSAVAAYCNLSLVATINLTSEDAEVFNNFVEAATGSVTNLIVLNSQAQAEQRFRDIFTGKRERTNIRLEQSAMLSALAVESENASTVKVVQDTDWTSALQSLSTSTSHN